MRIFGRRRPHWAAGALSGLVYGTVQFVIRRGSFGDRVIFAVVIGTLFGLIMASLGPRGERRLFTVDGVILAPAQRNQVYEAIDRAKVPADPRLQVVAAKIARARTQFGNVTVQICVLAGIVALLIVLAVVNDPRDWIVVAIFVALAPWLLIQSRRRRVAADRYLAADLSYDEHPNSRPPGDTRTPTGCRHGEVRA